jgi:hypothetical protein
MLPGKKLLILHLAALLVAASPRASAAFENEPDGFDKAKFGTSVAGVRKVFPELKELTSQPGVPWAFYTLDDQSYWGLGPCKVTFGFFDDKLYEAKLDCGRDDKVGSILYEKFGRPSSEEENMTIWRSEKALVSMNRKVMTFALADPVRSQLLHEYLLQLVLTREFEARQKQAEAGGPAGKPATGSP